MESQNNRQVPLPLDLAAQGDEQAFAAVMRETMPLLRAQVKKFSVSGLDADDLMQEALMGLLGAVRTYRADGGASFTTYVSTCVRNRLISFARRNDAHNDREQPWEDEQSFSADEQEDPACQMQQREAVSLLREQLRQRLTDLEYDVLLMRLEDCSYEQVAARLGVSRKAVDNAVQRLRRKLAADSSF